MSEQEEGIPNGWKRLRIGRVLEYEWYVDVNGLPCQCTKRGLTSKNYIIIERIEPPKPVYVPWTYETCPAGVWVRKKHGSVVAMIVVITRDGVTAGSYFSFYDLFTLFEQLDRTPCGTLSNEKKAD